MKQLYFFLCLLFTTTLFAQDITPEVDIKLQLLNKNYVTTDILYDRVFPLVNLLEFNQLASDTSHINHFYQAYQTNEQSISLESFKNGFYIIKATWNGNETTKKVAKS